MPIQDLLSVIGLIGVVVGLFMNAWAVHRGNIQKRAEFLINLYNQFLTDDTLEFIIQLDYGSVKRINSKNEIVLNKILSLCDNIGHLYKTGNFTKFDLDYFAAEILMLKDNDVVKDYIKQMNEEYKDIKYYKHNILSKNILPFSDFMEVAKILEDRYVNGKMSFYEKYIKYRWMQKRKHEI